MSSLPTQTIDQVLHQYIEKLGIRWAIHYEIVSAFGVSIFCRREEHCHAVMIPEAGTTELLEQCLPHMVLELGRLALAERVDPIMAHPFLHTYGVEPTDATRAEFEKRSRWLALATAHVGMWTADLWQEHAPEMVSRQVRATLNAVGTMTSAMLKSILNDRMMWQALAIDIARVVRFGWEDRFPDLDALLRKDSSGMLEKFARRLAVVPQLGTEQEESLRIHEEQTQLLCEAFDAPFVPKLLKLTSGWHDWDTGPLIQTEASR